MGILRVTLRHASGLEPQICSRQSTLTGLLLLLPHPFSLEVFFPILPGSGPSHISPLLPEGLSQLQTQPFPSSE